MPLKTAKALRKEGRFDEALAALARGIDSGEVRPHQLDAVGRMVQKILAREGAPDAHHDVLVLGQCTTSYLKHALAAVALTQGLRLAVDEGGYDSVLQDLATLEGRPDAIVLLPWHQRLLAPGERSPAQRIEDELGFFRRAWDQVASAGSRLIQVGYDWTGPGAQGYALAGGVDSPVGLVRRMNDALREALPEGAYFVDLEQIAGYVGRRHFYEPRSYFWTKQPFGPEGLQELARHLGAGLRAVTTGPKKVLILDLDNTLWGGVVGEEGPLGVRLGDSAEGEAHRAFQRYCKALSERGVLLAVCSKNNPDDAREPFEQHPDMVLALDDFAAFEASWDPKSVAIERIAKTLRLGLDSFVFVDDNPAERSQVRMALPMVEVVELPPDPADYTRAVEQGLYFEAVAVGAADRKRSEQYRAEARRREIQHGVQSGGGSLDDYLSSLEMRAEVGPITDADMPRVTQLLGKTNQFNLTTRRHTAGDVRRMLAQPGSLGLSLRLVDRFGDYGLISVVLGVPEGEGTLRLDTWLMSCRAIARTVEVCMFNEVARRAAALGHTQLVGEFIPTAKNKLVVDFYDKLGFATAGPLGDGGRRYVLALADFEPRKTAVHVDAL